MEQNVEFIRDPKMNSTSKPFNLTEMSGKMIKEIHEGLKFIISSSTFLNIHHYLLYIFSIREKTNIYTFFFHLMCFVLNMQICLIRKVEYIRNFKKKIYKISIITWYCLTYPQGNKTSIHLPAHRVLFLLWWSFASLCLLSSFFWCSKV